MFTGIFKFFFQNQRLHLTHSIWQKFHLDGPLLAGIFGLMLAGLAILFSAGNADLMIIQSQGIKFILAFILMIVLAQIPPERYRNWAPWFYVITTVLLISVLLVGQVSQGARRWLGVGSLRFQPSELMKFAMPMMLAWYFHAQSLPPKFFKLILAGLLLLVPFFLIAKQPDLGTGLLIMASGTAVLFLAGMSWRLIISLVAGISVSMPFVWHFLHDYQKQRILTFLNPERDPLGNGYHIIQSKIAIGSGGIFGKGYLHGTQAHLAFLPEHATDFIFAVCGEELGLLGCIILIAIYLFIICRCLYISSQAQDTFTRLLAGSLGFTFFIGVFVNMGMVSGLLPVVGLPLPLVSYGGTAVITSFISFGLLMSIQTHRKLIGG